MCALEVDDPDVRLAGVQAFESFAEPRCAQSLARTSAKSRDAELDEARKAAIELLAELTDGEYGVDHAASTMRKPSSRRATRNKLTEPERNAIRRLIADAGGPAAELFANEFA